jgi:hypothetical protein
LFVVRKDHSIDKEKIFKILSQEFPQHYLPDEVVIVPRLPLTLHGKVNEKALIQEYKELHSAKGQHDFASFFKNNPELKIFSDLFWKVFGRKCHLQDNFYTLGIDSISAFRIISAIYQHYQRDITIKEFYSACNVEGLCRLVAKKSKVTLEAPMMPSRVVPLSGIEKNLAIANSLNTDCLWYNQTLVLKLTNFSPKSHFVLLNDALNNLINRHPSLKSRYIIEDGQYIKEVIATVSYTLRLYEERGKNEPLEDKVAKHLRHFDLSAPPAFECFYCANK